MVPSGRRGLTSRYVGSMRMNRTANTSTRPARRALILTAALGLLSGCEGGFLDPAGPVSAAGRTIFLDALVIMLAIVIPVIVATLVFAWWFRASNDRATYLPNWTFSGRIELIVWS